MLAYTIDLGVAQLNATMVVLVLLVNLYACFNANPSRRYLYAMTCVLACIYLGSYVILLADFPARVLTWSRVMRGVSLVAWVVVWIVPAIADVRIYRERKQASENLERAVEERLSGGVR